MKNLFLSLLAMAAVMVGCNNDDTPKPNRVVADELNIEFNLGMFGEQQSRVPGNPGGEITDGLDSLIRSVRVIALEHRASDAPGGPRVTQVADFTNLDLVNNPPLAMVLEVSDDNTAADTLMAEFDFILLTNVEDIDVMADEAGLVGKTRDEILMLLKPTGNTVTGTDNETYYKYNEAEHIFYIDMPDNMIYRDPDLSQNQNVFNDVCLTRIISQLEIKLDKEKKFAVRNALNDYETQDLTYIQSIDSIYLYLTSPDYSAAKTLNNRNADPNLSATKTLIGSMMEADSTASENHDITIDGTGPAAVPYAFDINYLTSFPTEGLGANSKVVIATTTTNGKRYYLLTLNKDLRENVRYVLTVKAFIGDGYDVFPIPDGEYTEVEFDLCFLDWDPVVDEDETDAESPVAP